MKFLLDENVDARLLPFLTDLGHDVTSVAKDYYYGLLDEDVLELAHQEHRILLTNIMILEFQTKVDRLVRCKLRHAEKDTEAL